MDLDFSKPLLCAALDQPTLNENLRLAEKIAAWVDVLKLNDDAVDDAGLASLVRPFQELGRPLFVDRKDFKGSRTMARRAHNAAELGVSFINAFAAADYLLKGPVEALEGSDTKLLVVTVPTHFDDAYCWKYHKRSLADTVLLFAETAVEFGAHGIILPVPTLHAVTDLEIEIRATPGISLSGDKPRDEQRSISTPAGAVRGGSKVVIVGGSIANHPDGPEIGACLVRKEMAEAWAAMN